jgi:hypothetical protein
MGTDFSFEIGSLAWNEWNECSGRAMEHLTAEALSGVIFSVFGPRLYGGNTVTLLSDFPRKCTTLRG